MNLSLVHTTDYLNLQSLAYTSMIYNSGSVAQNWRCIMYDHVRSSRLENQNVVRDARQTARVHKLNRVMGLVAILRECKRADKHRGWHEPKPHLATAHNPELRGTDPE